MLFSSNKALSWGRQRPIWSSLQLSPRVLKRTWRALDDPRLLQRIDASGARDYFREASLAGAEQELQDVDYMDDTVFPLLAKAYELIEKVKDF